MYTNTIQLDFQDFTDHITKFCFKMAYSVYLEDISPGDETFVYKIVVDEMNILDSKSNPKIEKSIAKISVERQTTKEYECVIL